MKKSKRLSKKVTEILRKVKKYISNNPHIPFAFIFGSYAEGRETTLSDIDIAIYFKGMKEGEKIKIEHRLLSLFDEQVNILRLEDEDLSPIVRLRAIDGIPILINDKDLLNRFILSIIHRASESENLLKRHRRIA